MKTIKRLIPAAAVISFTMLVSIFMYTKVLEYEQQQCWQELAGTAQTVKEEISTKFQDEIIKLHLMEEIIVSNEIFSQENIEKLYLDIVQPTTIFSRIDILYPDNTIVSNGTTILTDGNVDFNEMVKSGEHMSRRKTDFITGKEYVYYILPIDNEGQISAILIAALDTSSLPQIFQPTIYNGEADVCIVDAIDGSYIMDSWHETLGNVYNDEKRKMMRGYEHVNAQDALRNMDTGTAAFYSNTNSKPIYLYFTPMGIFDWQLSIFAQENILFANMTHIRNIFTAASIAEVILVSLYFLIHFKNIRKLEQSYAQIQQQKEELVRISYTDQLTKLHNRNKFTEVLKHLRKQQLFKFAAIYMDLNGLKQLNDSKSHEAGDRYIKKFAATMTDVFPDYCYRIGGDEFVVMIPNIERELFLKRIDEFTRALDHAGISVSIGSTWEEQCKNVDNALKKAEKRMYEEKDIYYAVSGKRR